MKKNRLGLIYKAISPSGFYYIGYTINLLNRQKSHKNNSFNLRSKEYDLAFHCAIRKYGFENIHWEILEDNIPEDLLGTKEREWIEKLNAFKNGYNETLGGDGRVPSEEEKQKLSLLKKGIPRNKEVIRRSVNTKRERGWYLPENNPMFGVDRKGEKAPNFGKKFTEQHKENISKTRIEKELSKSFNNGMFGKKHTKEARENISKAATGRPSLLKKKIQCIETKQIFNSITEAAKYLNGNRSNLSSFLNGKGNSFMGLTFRFLKEDEFNEK